MTGTRPSLTSGRLGVLVVDRPGAIGHGHGRAPGGRGRRPRSGLDAPEPLHAGVDGEAVELHPPLEVVIQPAALQVRISSRHPGVSPSSLVRP